MCCCFIFYTLSCFIHIIYIYIYYCLGIKSQDCGSGSDPSDDSNSESSLSSSSDSDNDDSSDDDDEISEYDMLYDGAPLNVSSFCYLVSLYCIQHSLSDSAKDNLLKLISCVLPVENKCPMTVYRLNKMTEEFELDKCHYKLCRMCHSELTQERCVNSACDLSDPVTKLTTNDMLSYYIFNIESQLQRIISGIHTKFNNAAIPQTHAK